MRMVIRGIRERGLPDERIVFDVSARVNIGSYLLVVTQFAAGGRISSNARGVYWFPDKTVDGGDVVVIYTRSGDTNEKTMTDGSKSHFFYWGQPKSIWKPDGVVAVLIKADEWESKSPDD